MQKDSEPWQAEEKVTFKVTRRQNLGEDSSRFLSDPSTRFNNNSKSPRRNRYSSDMNFAEENASEKYRIVSNARGLGAKTLQMDIIGDEKREKLSIANVQDLANKIKERERSNGSNRSV